MGIFFAAKDALGTGAGWASIGYVSFSFVSPTAKNLW